MEVDRPSFPARLPTILRDISKAKFIAVDLELSGIPVNRFREGKQSLQERYAEVKQAAEHFHILQVGLTCVEQDDSPDGNGHFILRPYNFNLSPLIFDGLEIERNFTYSSSAVEFLLKHNYDMNSPFDAGIPYLSKAETLLAKERAIMRWDKGAIPDIRIRPDDSQALNFIERVHREVDAWERAKEGKKDNCSILGTARPTNEEPNARDALSRFEKRLVHQIIRADYPKLQTYSTPDSVQVQDRNEKEQALENEALQRRLSQAIFNQVGFRWIAEAMAGGNLSGLEPSLLARRIDGERPYSDLTSFTDRLNEIKSALQSRRTTLIGHNCFLDLVYFYKHFYGSLPDTVVEFQAILHEMFPLVIDTKYVATASPDGAKYRSSQLWQIDESLANEALPVIEMGPNHSSYTDSQQYHEAGYDSFVTAKVFLRLAAKLQGVVEATKPNAASTTESHPPVQTRKKKGSILETITSKFSTKNVYDLLKGLPNDAPAPDDFTEKPVSSSNAIKPGKESEVANRLETMSVNNAHEFSRDHSKTMLDWDSDFWSTYGNKMRVFGTVEEVFTPGTNAAEAPPLSREYE